jgi:hypothetical protein
MASINNPFETDEVVGVVSAAASQGLRRAAEAAGFAVETVCDPASIDVDGDRSDDSMFDTVLRFFQEGEEKDALRKYHERLVDGDHVIRILEVGDRADEAGKLMAANEAEIVWHFGDWTYKPLHST